jgi:DNA polymerase-3 subunit alpha
MQPSFIHLRLHSEFSLVDGIVKIKPLVKRLTELNMPAVAITEQGNLFSLVKFYKATIGAGIKAIAGSDVYIFNPEDPSNPYHLTLLVNNKVGYVSLTELISKAYQEGQYLGIPILKAEWLEENHSGLIALSGAMQGEIGRALIAGKPAVAIEKAQKWASVFKDSFYLEIQRVGKLDEERYIHAAIQLAIDLDLPVVATNDVRFLDKKDFAAHEVRVCINQGRVLDDARRPKNYTEQQYLRSSEEMQALFADIPEALANTVEIAKRCNLQLTLGENYLPDFPVPAGITLEQHFRQASKQGLEERLIEHPPIGKGSFAENRIAYDQRLEIELNVICQMGFPGYFMIVADFIQWAKNQAIPVGPGRGSGAGSLVAYVLKITDLDPLEFELLFERFLNPERVSMPDFDIDFCMDRRDEVIDYVARRYGRNRVSQIITYGSMAAKAVIRDVGRVLNHGYGFVDRLAKLIPFEIGITLDKALKDSSELRGLYESDDEVKNLINMALSLEGVVRNAGKHAGGVVISPTKLTDFSPLYCDEEGNNLVTQFDKDDVEAVGLVKFDFLGLRTLTIIDWALQTINKKKRSQGEAEVDIAQIPRDDVDSYKLLQNAQTTAVFQLESRGMKELISRLKPDCFDDIIALVALYRPGPLESGMVDDYVKVKHGQQAAEYAHPLLIPVLKPTNGVILYQEQVMQIAREMASYTLGGADMLRRAMGKKKPEEMAKERDKFLSGSIENKISQDIANYVFDLMEKFAGYGFNKSHSAAYALVAYQTAWLKAHYPAEFMAAVLSADMDNTDKIVVLVEECRQMKLTVCPPNVNLSEHQFTVNTAGQIVYGLGAIKGAGQSALDDLLAERRENGDFSSFYDLCKRVVNRKVNRRVMESLIKSGAFDSLDDNPAKLFAQLPEALRMAEQYGKSAATGQNDFFGMMNEEAETADPVFEITHVEPWTMRERLESEKITLGLYLTGHPIDQYEQELKNFTSGKIAKLIEDAEKSRNKMDAKIAGFLVNIQKYDNRAILTLDDRSARLEITAYSEVYEKYRNLLSKDSLLVIDISFPVKNEYSNSRPTVKAIYDMEQARATFANGLFFEWSVQHNPCSTLEFMQTLREILVPFRGGECRLIMRYVSANAVANLVLGDEWKVHVSDELLVRLQRFSVISGVEVKYK